MSAPAPNPTAQTRRILLVDDSHEFTELLKEYLLMQKQRNWIVHTSDSYSPALDCLNKNTVDLLVLDINMPVMDGLQFLTLLKRTRPALPVVILSGLITEDSRNYALRHGATLVLDKAEVRNGFGTIYAALEASAEAPTSGFKGVLREVGLPDLVQMECLGRKSSVLDVTAANATGRIYICDGTIIHAECGQVSGEPALARLLGLKGGEFRFGPFKAPAHQTIDGHWEALLMEAARVQDEEAGAMVEEETSPLKAVPAPPPKPPCDRHVEEMVICSAGNEILYQWKAPQGKTAAPVGDRRERLMGWLANKSAGISKILPLGRVDRFEINSDDSRVLITLQPDRKLLVRISIVPRN
jgi:two-component system chemotaxis response regulator CheB